MKGERTVRDIRIGFPSCELKMTLFKDTEDEQAFKIKSLKRGKPYVFAYGVKYYLTQEEIKEANKLQKIFQK